MASSKSPTPFSFVNNSNTNTNNNNTTGQLRQQQVPSAMFSNTNSNMNNNNNNSNSEMKPNVSSVMGAQGKESPMMSFLRSKTSGNNNNNNNNMMSMTGQQQQQQFPVSAVASMNTMNHSAGGLLDATPMSTASSTNPFLRTQMMKNLDQSVNRNSSTRGRLGGLAGSRGLSSSVRKSMMQSMHTGTNSGRISKSCKELKVNYEHAGIISRHDSADHIPTRRASLTAGAAKAQNRRQNLSRSNNSFGNLTRGKGSRKDLKSGSGHSTRSLPAKSMDRSSTRSLSSEDSSGSLIPVKRSSTGGRGGRGGHGAKHGLGSRRGSARRISSVPYLGSSAGESAASFQQRLEDQQKGPQQNSGWD